MNEINNVTNYRDIKFTRDTKVDYKSNNNNPIFMSLFKKWDTDFSGDFSDEEWAKYEKSLVDISTRKKNTTVSDGAIKHYDKELAKVYQKREAIFAEYDKLDTEAWGALLAFEDKHPGIGRRGCKKGEEIPKEKGIQEYDISPFGMGIVDDKDQNFTGEVYENGYLFGLETLSEAERKQYLNLLDRASKSIKAAAEIDKKVIKNDAELEKAKALVDMANSGIIKEIGSSEYEQEMCEAYANVVSESNPFIGEIRSLEQKINSLRRKVNPTIEDLNQIEQYRIQLGQLQTASASWSVGDAQNVSDVKPRKEGVNINNISVETTYKYGESGSATLTPSVDLKYVKPNWNLGVELNSNQTYNIGSNNYTSTLTTNLGANFYNSNVNYSVNAGFETYDNYKSTTYNFGGGAQYRNVGVSVSERISVDPSREANQPKTLYTTSGTVSYNVGGYNSSLTYSHDESSQVLRMYNSARYNIKLDKSSRINIVPSVTGSYNFDTNSYTVAPTLYAGYSYNSKDVDYNLSLTEQHSTTMIPGHNPQFNHTFMAQSDLRYKDFTYSLGFSDSDFSQRHSNSYSVGVAWRTGAGTFGLKGSYEHMDPKRQMGNNNETYSLSVSYAVPIKM